MKNKKELIINIILYIGLIIFGLFVLLSFVGDYLYEDIFKVLGLSWIERNSNTINYILLPIVLIGLIYTIFKSDKK